MRNANKRHIQESAELLDLKQRLRELDFKLLNPDDLEILIKKRVLRDKISELEKDPVLAPAELHAGT